MLVVREVLRSLSFIAILNFHKMLFHDYQTSLLFLNLFCISFFQMHRALRPQDEVAKRITRNHREENIQKLRHVEEKYKQRQADMRPKPSFKLKRFQYSNVLYLLCSAFSRSSLILGYSFSSDFNAFFDMIVLSPNR